MAFRYRDDSGHFISRDTFEQDGGTREEYLTLREERELAEQAEREVEREREEAEERERQEEAERQREERQRELDEIDYSGDEDEGFDSFDFDEEDLYSGE